MVLLDGIDPTSLDYQSSALPLSYRSMVLRHGIEPHPLVLQTSVRTSYTSEALMEDWVGLEPTMLYSRLKVCAVRHYGNQSNLCGLRLNTDYIHRLSSLAIHTNLGSG